MKNKIKIPNQELLRFAIIAYWSIFWLLNCVDKLIGGSMFLWVGRDRFAQFQKFFDSAGLESPAIANTALVVVAGLEVFAFVFFVGSLLYYLKQKKEASRSYFFIGIVFTLAIFTLFSIGDHVFGDRFELLEHTLFWFLTLFSWVLFIRLDRLPSSETTQQSKKQLFAASFVALFLVMVTSFSIFQYNSNFFYRRTDAVNSEKVGENIYKFAFPFLGGSTVFEKSIAKFKKEHPNERIDHIYTVPNELRLKKADALVFYVITEDKE
jgi:hypothetical protein